MLVSIQFASGCSVLKNWSIHSVTESFVVHKVYVALRDETLEELEGLECFKFPAELRDQPYRSFVGRSQTVEFQNVVTAKIRELVELFG